MINRKVLSAIVLFTPVLAMGQGATSYECTMDGKQRRVVILTEPGVTVPCEVQYHKDTEAPGQVQVLWSASSQAGYCEAKTEEFVGKLQEWGWTCEAADGFTAGAEAEPAAPELESEAESELSDEAEEITDDTSDLEPGS